MKAMLIIFIVGSNYQGERIKTIEVPMSTYKHCTDIAEDIGMLIAEDLGDYAYSVSTECVNQGE